MTILLNLDPSPSFSALLVEIAASAGLALEQCPHETAAVERLGSTRPCALMVVPNQLAGGDSLRMIRNARLLPARATMPIAFVMSGRDLDVARNALQAGATEVFPRSAVDSLGAFIGECANEPVNPTLNGRVLLVEDSDSQAAYVGYLCTALGLEVDVCRTVDEAVAALRGQAYHLVIVDVVLLGMQSGLALVRHIRQQPRSAARLPVLAMSGFDDVARRVEALRCGADDFISKPFAHEEFVLRLRRILQLGQLADAGAHGGIGPASPRLPLWQRQGLSLREAEICEALLQGRSDKQIAAELDISFWTVRTHVGNIFAKLGLLNRRELMARYRDARA